MTQTKLTKSKLTKMQWKLLRDVDKLETAGNFIEYHPSMEFAKTFSMLLTLELIQQNDKGMLSIAPAGRELIQYEWKRQARLRGHIKPRFTANGEPIDEH